MRMFCCLPYNATTRQKVNNFFEYFFQEYAAEDSDSPEGFWSGEKILTNDDVTGVLAAPQVLEVDADGNLLILATKL